MRFFLLIITIVGFAGCDSASPDSNLLSFEVSGVPLGGDVEIDDTATVAFPRFDGPASPRVTVTATPRLAILSQDGGIILHSLQEGDASLSIRASASGYRDTTIVITFHVTPGLCPPGQSAGQFDLFPIHDGSPVSYTGVARTELGGADIPLDMTLEFVGQVCRDGHRSGTIRYAFTGGPVETYPFTESASNAVSFQTPAYVGIRRSVTLQRFSNAATLRISHGCVDGRLDFAAGQGLVEEFFSCAGPTSSYSSRRLTLRP